MKLVNGIVLGVLAFVVGCGTPDTGAPSASNQPNAQGAKFVSSTEPPDAVAVGMARETIESDQEVTLVGRIGGSTDPFVDGLAAFTIVDPKVPYCSADEGCPTPWDYCCTQDQVRHNIATVKVLDESGKPVAGDARKLLGVRELSTVVVQGKATRDDQGNLTVATSSIYIRSDE